MGETLEMRVARALRRARSAQGGLDEGCARATLERDGDRNAPKDEKIALACAAIETCFDDIWSDGYVVGSKFGSSGMSAELLRAAAKEQILSRTRTPVDQLPAGEGRPADHPIARAEAMLRQLLEQSRSGRS